MRTDTRTPLVQRGQIIIGHHCCQLIIFVVRSSLLEVACWEVSLSEAEFSQLVTSGINLLARALDLAEVPHSLEFSVVVVVGIRELGGQVEEITTVASMTVNLVLACGLAHHNTDETDEGSNANIPESCSEVSDGHGSSGVVDSSIPA